MAEHQSDLYFANPTTGALRSPTPYKELLACLGRITTLNPPVHTCSTGWAFHGFYSGPTSIAYLFWRLSILYPELEFKQQSLLEWAESYLSLGAPGHRPAPTANNCGIDNETLAHTAMEVLMADDAGAARKLCSFERVINDEINDDGFNDWRYGRAGYLYYLRLCKSSPSFIDNPRINEAIEKTVRRILKVPQPWIRHGKETAGPQGTVGIICQIVLSMPQVAAELQELLASLLDEHFDDGIVQFCQGGPGFVLSLRSLQPYYPDLATKIAAAISRAQSDLWRRGLLKKMPCLCHGIAGNALALDDQAQFLHFLSFMSTEDMAERGWLRDIELSRQDMASLFTGEAGRAWSWAVADQSLSKTCIGFNDV
ncbi:hypothetical protein PG996_012008 [Apiospora saccharicola]|uniref:Uncharacterized protein n=1 Tax=Apiospora saccharicola TaxID=335842 RepID=A0ABR1U1C4_9PEZI